jgi:hypothetical protein
LRLCELPSPNLGQYSPTQTFIATSATDALLALKSKIDIDKTVIVTEPLTGGLTNITLFTAHQGLQVKAKSSGQSIALIPVQFSQCLRLVPATPQTRLFRVNLMETGVAVHWHD